MRLDGRCRAAWAHDFNPDRAVGATFQALPGASFVVNGARQASDSALTTASAELKWINGWSAAATFEGEFSNVTRSYAGKGVVRYAWKRVLDCIADLCLNTPWAPDEIILQSQ